MQQVKTQMIDLATDALGRFIYLRSGVNAPQKISKEMKIRGHRVWYQDVGEGRPLVFLHGLGSNSLSWLLTVPGFSSKHRVIAIDHIGHGRSDKPVIAYRVTDFVDYIEEFLTNLKFGEVDLVGNSLGGWIGARLALRRPELVSKLVLVGSAGLQPWPELKEKLEKVPFAPRTAKEVKELLSMCFYDKLRYTNQITVLVSYLLRMLDSSYSTIEKVIESVLDPNEWLDGKLHEIKAETLVLWGKEDELMPVEFAYQFAENIPKTQLKIIPQCGHVPQIEKPKEFNQMLRDFLK